MAVKQAKRQRREAQACCSWRFWQEPLTDDDGNLVDEAGQPSRKPIMAWRETGKPCDDCLATEYRAITNRCAEGKCKSGRNCPKHRHRYLQAPCFGCGHYHKRESGCGHRGCDCESTIEWPSSYPLPESATNKGGDGKRKAIQAYHRGTDGQVAARQQRQAEREAEQAKTILPMQGPEAEQYWGSLNKRLSALMKPDALTAMARRILTAQRDEGHKASAFGEGLNGTITLEVNADQQLEALIREQQADSEQQAMLDDDISEGMYDEDAPDEDDEDTYQQQPDDDGDFDLDYLIRSA